MPNFYRNNRVDYERRIGLQQSSQSVRGALFEPFAYAVVNEAQFFRVLPPARSHKLLTEVNMLPFSKFLGILKEQRVKQCIWRYWGCLVGERLFLFTRLLHGCAYATPLNSVRAMLV